MSAPLAVLAELLERDLRNIVEGLHALEPIQLTTEVSDGDEPPLTLQLAVT